MLAPTGRREPRKPWRPPPRGGLLGLWANCRVSRASRAEDGDSGLAGVIDIDWRWCRQLLREACGRSITSSQERHARKYVPKFSAPMRGEDHEMGTCRHWCLLTPGPIAGLPDRCAR